METGGERKGVFPHGDHRGCYVFEGEKWRNRRQFWGCGTNYSAPQPCVNRESVKYLRQGR